MASHDRMSEAAWLAVFAAILTGGGTAFVFFYGYEPLIQNLIDLGEPGESKIVSYLLPFLTDLGVGGAILWAVAAAGFFTRQQWALKVALTGCVVNLLTGFFPMIPMTAHGVFPPSPFLVFLPNVLFFFLLTRRYNQAPGWVVAVAFLGALAMIWAFTNGIASTHRIMDHLGLIYIFIQRLHWFMAAAWAVFAIALVTRKSWAYGLGIGVAGAALIFGAPLAIMDIQLLGRFSMFGISPIYAVLMLVLLITRSSREALNRWSVQTPA